MSIESVQDLSLCLGMTLLFGSFHFSLLLLVDKVMKNENMLPKESYRISDRVNVTRNNWIYEKFETQVFLVKSIHGSNTQSRYIFINIILDINTIMSDWVSDESC